MAHKAEEPTAPPVGSDVRRALGGCHGFLALADDGELGEIETPLFASDADRPDYLIVRTSGRFRRARRPVVPAVRAEGVDRERRLVYLRGTVAELADLPESLPLVGRRGDAL